MPQVNNNSCRVCLRPGLKPIFSPEESVIKHPLYDRLAEKMRFVSMLPVTESDSLPKFLCYSCIVQLNSAYSFKNTMIETNMYLERLSIECGSVSLTPAPSSVMDDDEASVISSNQLDTPSTMPPPAVSVSSMSPINGYRSVNNTEVSNSSATVTTPLLTPEEIKVEPVNIDENDPRIQEFVLQVAIEEVIAQPDKSKSTGTVTPKQRGRPRVSAGVTPLLRSPSKRAMVAVHNEIDLNHQSDKAYLKGLQRDNIVSNGRSSRLRLSKNIVDKARQSLKKSHRRSKEGMLLREDADHSKAVRDILTNMPASRLRKRRTST